ncbi:MAG: thiamine ABC transporter substrate-binding protein, partial [Anaerolineae bacterium]|nr:thiamine ABC transporter substrate-binding protein [Anaerolineae bacterium]
MKVRWFAALVLLLAISTSAVAQNEPVTITLVTHDSFNVSEEVLNAFQESNGIRVEILRSGDAGTMVNQAILSIGNPLGDVLFGVDNTFLGRALDADIFTPYESPLLDTVDAAFQVDPEHRVTPIDYGDVCLNYDVAYFEVAGVGVPSRLEALTQPEYADLLAVQNPATSSPGLAFLLTTIAHFGTEGEYTYLDYWQDLVKNGVYIADDWSDAYYGQFSGSTGSEGSRPLVVSYASSPPAEVFFAETPSDTAPTASIIAEGMCFRQIEFAGILKGTDQPE